MESSPELSVVCRSCGSEVSPYVTECPYCGTRLRKRAPRLQRQGDELLAREGLRERHRRRAAARRARRRPALALEGERPYATIAAIVAPAVLLIVERAADLTPYEVGAIFGPVGDDWWRYLVAPFVYDDLGYLFVIAVALAIFMPGVERRVGPIATSLLLLACGGLSMLAADGLDLAISDGFPIAAGGNGAALGILGAWIVLREAEAHEEGGEDFDRVAVAVAAAVLLLLPLVEDYASAWAGLGGGLVGLAYGYAAALRRRPIG